MAAGFIINDTSDADYIAAKIALMLDENIRRNMSQGAYQTALKNTWDQAAKKYQEIYTDILASRKKNAGF